MQKVRYCLSFNSLNIKFQNLFTQVLTKMVLVNLFTVHSHYFPLSILSYTTLEIDFPLFSRRSSFYEILIVAWKHVSKLAR